MKKIFKITVLLSLITIIFSSCSEDIYENTHTENYTINYQEFKKVTKINNVQRYLFQKIQSKGLGKSNKNINQFYIDTTYINQYTKGSGDACYSFRIYPNDTITSPNIAYNLVLNKINAQWETYIYKINKNPTPINGKSIASVCEEFKSIGLPFANSQSRIGITFIETIYPHCTFNECIEKGYCDLCYRCATIVLSIAQSYTEEENVAPEQPSFIMNIGEPTGGGPAINTTQSIVNQIKILMPTLSIQEESYLNQNPDVASSVLGYLLTNSTIESQQFVKECIIKIQQNPTIFTSITPFIIEKNIDDSQLDPCAKSVFQQIKNTTNNDFAKVLAKLGADNSVYNTTVKTEYHYNSNGQLINPPAHTVRTSAYNYSIYVSPDYNDKTKLHIASFLLHEMVHAYFFSLIDDCYLQNNCALLETFPQLWDYYVNHCNSQYPSDPVSHHNQIANSYVSAIASALQEYQPGLPQQVYEDLAWAGLEETTIFNTLHPVGSSSRQRILNRKAAEQTGHPVAQGTPQEQINYGQPCN